MKQNKGQILADSIHQFSMSLQGMAEKEVYKAKELFLRNAIADYHNEKKKYRNNWIPMAFFLLIPIFWIFLIPTIRNEYLDVQNMKTQINNALEVWSDDLQDKKVILQKLLEGDRYWG